MSDSLKDQLLALGLAKPKPKPKQKPKGKRPGGRKGKSPQQKAADAQRSGADISLDAAYRLRQKQEKASAEKIKADKRALDLERRQLNKKLQSLIEGKTLNDPKAEIKRNFLYKGRIRSVLVNEAQLQALNEGSLFLVFLRGSYLIIDPALKSAIEAISPEHLPDLSGGEVDEGDHPVPDDLIW